MNIIVRLADGSVDTFADREWTQIGDDGDLEYYSSRHSFEVDSQNSLTVTKGRTTVVGYYRSDQYTTVRENP